MNKRKIENIKKVIIEKLLIFSFLGLILFLFGIVGNMDYETKLLEQEVDNELYEYRMNLNNR